MVNRAMTSYLMSRGYQVVLPVDWVRILTTEGQFPGVVIGKESENFRLKTILQGTFGFSQYCKGYEKK